MNLSPFERAKASEKMWKQLRIFISIGQFSDDETNPYCVKQKQLCEIKALDDLITITCPKRFFLFQICWQLNIFGFINAAHKRIYNGHSFMRIEYALQTLQITSPMQYTNWNTSGLSVKRVEDLLSAFAWEIHQVLLLTHNTIPYLALKFLDKEHLCGKARTVVFFSSDIIAKQENREFTLKLAYYNFMRKWISYIRTYPSRIFGVNYIWNVVENISTVEETRESHRSVIGDTEMKQRLTDGTTRETLIEVPIIEINTVVQMKQRATFKLTRISEQLGVTDV